MQMPASAGALSNICKRWQRPVHISQRILDGFAVLPQRWAVERTFAWFNGQRRLSKDYEKTTSSSEAMILIAALGLPR
jgi:putative transposase